MTPEVEVPVPDPADPDRLPSPTRRAASRPGLVRGVGAVVAGAALTVLVAYLVVPVGDGAGGTTTFAALDSAYQRSGLVSWCLLVTALAGAAVVRPALGAETVALGAVASPWVVRMAGLLVDVPDRHGVATVIAGAALVLLVGLVAALVVAVVAGRRPPGGLLVADAVAVVVGAGALWATLGIGWYRVKDLVSGAVTGARFGGLLDADTWAGRATWVALLVAFGALVVAVGAGGRSRRAAGAVLVAVMGIEAVRRMVLPAEAFFPPSSSTFGPVLGATPVPVAVLAQVVGAIAGAWLLTSAGDEPVTAAADPAAADDL